MIKQPRARMRGRASLIPYVRNFLCGATSLSFGVLMLSTASASSGGYVAGNTISAISSATPAGVANSSATITIALWLKPHNQEALGALAADLYNPTSPRYRRWLKFSDVAASFGPSAAESKTVRQFIKAQGLTFLDEEPNHFYVRAQGTVAQMESAFRIHLNTYTVAGRSFRANDADPFIAGDAAALVQTVSGLDDIAFEQDTKLRPSSLSDTGKSHAAGDLAWAASSAAPSGFHAACFKAPSSVNYSTSGSYPMATYTGNIYNNSGAGCGYTPANVAKAYGLDALYKKGLDGTGQTIVLIDPCGSTTILSDANTFSQAFGLPALTAQNFSVLQYPSPSACAGEAPSVNADVEWAHAIAPGANIIDLVTPGGDTEDVDEATFHAITYGLGNVISGSFFDPEVFFAKSEAKKENLIAEIAAVTGISTNYASGDDSNYTYFHLPPSVSLPASLPYATGIGGITTAINTDGSLGFQTAWETHVSVVVGDGMVEDPYVSYDIYGFAGGSGGGLSTFFEKPSYQSALKYHARAVPDIAWLADPDTGGLIVVTQTTTYPPQIWYAYGGTELATPMFSALWAIANQAAGQPLGQAAPYLYAMPASTITDILATPKSHDVTATVSESAGDTRKFTAAQTLGIDTGLFTRDFLTALDVEAEGSVFDISFGQDYRLHPGSGFRFHHRSRHAEREEFRRMVRARRLEITLLRNRSGRDALP